MKIINYNNSIDHDEYKPYIVSMVIRKYDLATHPVFDTFANKGKRKIFKRKLIYF